MNDDPPFPWMKDKPDTYRYHLENDTGTFFEYTRRKRLELGKSLLTQRRIYLDTKYWLYIRDVYLNRPQKAIHADILTELRRLRHAGTTICPMSYAVFIELLNQKDAESRKATAKMIDELSDDCTIQPPLEVFKCELHHFFSRYTSPDTPVYDRKQLVWTKAVFVVGDAFLDLHGSGFPEPVALAMRKAIDDDLWAMKLSEMIQELPPNEEMEKSQLFNLAERLSEGKREHAGECDTFEKLFLDEVAGGLLGFSDVIADFTVYIARKNGIQSEIPSKQSLEGGRMFASLIHAAFKHKRIATEFATIDIPAALHALVRLDKKRGYKDTDFADFQHSALAVGYCDVFLTEAGLRHLLMSNKVDASKRYGCTVVSNESEVLAFLRSIK